MSHFSFKKRFMWSYLFAFFSFISLLSIAYAQPISINQTNYTVEQANATIREVSAYINKINMSGYLIFAPKLKGAYAYIDKAESVSKAYPSLAVSYALQARGAAQQAYEEIGTYREMSFYVMLAFTIAALAALYIFMKPVKKRHKKRAAAKRSKKKAQNVSLLHFKTV